MHPLSRRTVTLVTSQHQAKEKRCLVGFARHGLQQSPSGEFLTVANPRSERNLSRRKPIAWSTDHQPLGGLKQGGFCDNAGVHGLQHADSPPPDGSVMAELAIPLRTDIDEGGLGKFHIMREAFLFNESSKLLLERV